MGAGAVSHQRYHRWRCGDRIGDLVLVAPLMEGPGRWLIRRPCGHEFTTQPAAALRYGCRACRRKPFLCLSCGTKRRAAFPASGECKSSCMACMKRRERNGRCSCGRPIRKMFLEAGSPVNAPHPVIPCECGA